MALTVVAPTFRFEQRRDEIVDKLLEARLRVEAVIRETLDAAHARGQATTD